MHPPPQDPMYGQFLKGGLDGLEDSWEAGISTIEGDIYIEKPAVRTGRNRAAPEEPLVTARSGWTDRPPRATLLTQRTRPIQV
jgi:hypothetical protein